MVGSEAADDAEAEDVAGSSEAGASKTNSAAVGRSAFTGVVWRVAVGSTVGSKSPGTNSSASAFRVNEGASRLSFDMLRAVKRPLVGQFKV